MAKADAVVLLGACLVLGGLAIVAPYEVAIGVLAIAWLARTRLVERHAIAIVVLVGLAVAVTIGGWRAWRAVHAFEAKRTSVMYATGPPSRCEGEGTVVGAPVFVRGDLRWDAELRGVACESASSAWDGRVTLYGGPADLARGDRVRVLAQLGTPQRLWNDATGDPRPGEARRGVVRSGAALHVRVDARAAGVLAVIDRARAAVRARILATFPADTQAMARALVLGEEDLATDDSAAFRASGLAHLLAVSGMHLVIVVLGALAALRAIVVRVEAIAARADGGRLVAAVGLPLTWAYASFAGASGSTLRAAWMLSAALLARALGRRSDAVRAFGLSLLAMAVVDPLAAFDASLTLSAAATAGLLFLSKPFTARFVRHVRAPPLVWLARSFATTLAATIPCTPILARFAPSVPLGGVIANVLAVPLGESIALPLCLAHALLAPWPAAERGCALAASGALAIVRAIARGFSDARALSFEVPTPTSWQLVVLAVCAAALIAARRGRAFIAPAACAALLVLEIAARRKGAPTNVLRATFLDVGQGDAALVDLPDGQAMLIDGGGIVGSPVDVGARVIAPTLRARRRAELALVVLSHPHPDHYGGLASGLASTRAAALWDTGQGEREGVGGPYAALLASQRRACASIARPAVLCGAHVVGGARVDVLAPCPGPHADRGANDNSFVLRIAYGRRALLFVGDAEHEEEQELLADPVVRDRLRADVLKVGHHGSRTSSSPAFVAAVAPSHAVVSSGVRNRFGHPHASTIDTLARANARTWRTDQQGAIVVETDGERLTVQSARGD